jgi:hypothetical protein
LPVAAVAHVDDPFASSAVEPPPPLPSPDPWEVTPATVVDPALAEAPGAPSPIEAPAPALAAWPATPDAPAPPPMKLTPTMVMKLEPAEQRRLLALLLERANVGMEVLSSPPTPASDDDPTTR